VIRRVRNLVDDAVAAEVDVDQVIDVLRAVWRTRQE
jgi:hypothetical protein